MSHALSPTCNEQIAYQQAKLDCLLTHLRVYCNVPEDS